MDDFHIQLCLKFSERHIGLLCHRAKNEGRLGLDAPRPPIAALALWRESTARTNLGSPTDGALSTHAKPRAAAWRHDIPLAIAPTTRAPRSKDSDRAMHAGLLRQHAA
jgi:hypothetical protein